MTRSLRWTSNSALLAYAVVVGFALVVGSASYGSYQRRARQAHETAVLVPIRHLATRIDLAPQLPLQAIAGLRDRGYATVIDLRPDGEDASEPPSAEMAKHAQTAGIRFHYVPVPHGDIPEAAVNQLRHALAEAPGETVLLYCRSGRRAARTWALAEAGRPGGLSVPQVLDAVKAAGQDATDLIERLEANAARRGAQGG